MNEEKLIALVDGELGEPERAEIEAAAAADPQLAARIDLHRRLRAKLARAYGPIAEEQAPEALVNSAMRACSTNVAPFPAARSRRSLALLAGALAASLVIGVLIGRFALDDGRFVVADARGLRAGEALSRFLDNQLASEAEPVDASRITLSFRNRDGEYCRMYELPQSAGLACKAGGIWRVEVAESIQAGRGGYRVAGVEAPASLAAMDATIEGEPLDAAGERAARVRRWRADQGPGPKE